MDKKIKAAAEKTLGILKIKGASITITPSIISFENLTREEANLIKDAFMASGMKTLAVTDLSEIEMGTGFEISIVR